MSILDILNELAATSSTNAKVEILKREKDNTDLKEVFQAAYNPMVSYYINKIPQYEQTTIDLTVCNAMDILLTHLSSRSVTGNKAIEFTANILSRLNKDDAIVLERIIQRDLRCGTSDTLASRVWPGLVPTFDVMLSHKDISGIKFPAYAQIKSDGARCHMYFDGTKATAFSRNGKPIELHGVFDKDIAMFIGAGECLDGELLAVKDGKVLDRKTGNGIVNQAVKGTITKESAEMLVFACWDIVDFTSTIPYRTRIDRLSSAYVKASTDGRFTNHIMVLGTVTVKNKEEAEEFFAKCIAQGEEGAMIKNIDAVWQPKRTKDLGKMKSEEVGDLLVVDVEEGTGKYFGMIGSLVCETSDGKLRVNVGTGLSDADRAMGPEYYVGKVVEVMYNQLITSKGKDTASLFLPRLLSVRVDKDVANTLEELK